jgi:hypothetical protein
MWGHSPTKTGRARGKLVETRRRAHLGTTTKTGSHANRNAGFIRQAGKWHWGCRMNPAFRWWCQDAPRRRQDGIKFLSCMSQTE